MFFFYKKENVKNKNKLKNKRRVEEMQIPNLKKINKNPQNLCVPRIFVLKNISEKRN